MGRRRSPIKRSKVLTGTTKDKKKDRLVRDAKYLHGKYGVTAPSPHDLASDLPLPPFITTAYYSATELRIISAVYRMLLPDERRVLLESDDEIQAELARLRAAVHPWYGECDGMGRDGTCAECVKCIAMERAGEPQLTLVPLRSLKRLITAATAWHSALAKQGACFAEAEELEAAVADLKTSEKKS